MPKGMVGELKRGEDTAGDASFVVRGIAQGARCPFGRHLKIRKTMPGKFGV
jgi:hypothetical protein